MTREAASLPEKKELADSGTAKKTGSDRQSAASSTPGSRTPRSGHLPVPRNRAPNVLFIAVDDMNDWPGCYGGHPDARTPNLDRLAKRGVLFTNAHCVSPICGPSRAAVLTGMRPETTGVYHNKGTYIDYVPDAVTFPEYFRGHGYRTLAAGKVNHGLGEPDPKLWDQNGPDCGVLGTPFLGDELDTASMQPTREIHRGRLSITLPANGGLSAIDRPHNKWPTGCPAGGPGRASRRVTAASPL